MLRRERRSAKSLEDRLVVLEHQGPGQAALAVFEIEQTRDRVPRVDGSGVHPQQVEIEAREQRVERIDPELLAEALRSPRGLHGLLEVAGELLRVAEVA